MMLVIGYGNPLRSDDAIGQRVAWELSRHFDRNEMSVRIVYQLTPELAEMVSHFDHVVFIDARVGAMPGQVIHENVRPFNCAGAFTHNVSPSVLLGMANELYGSSSTGTLISIVGEVFDYGTELSPQLCQLLPEITHTVTDIIRHCARIPTNMENDHA